MVIAVALAVAEAVHVAGRDDLRAGLRVGLVVGIALQIPCAALALRRSSTGVMVLLLCAVTAFVAALATGAVLAAVAAAAVLVLVSLSLRWFPTGGAMAELTRTDKIRRLAITLVRAGVHRRRRPGVASTREVDDNGDTVLDGRDPCEAILSGEDVDAPACDPSGEHPGRDRRAAVPPPDSEALQQVQVGIDLGSRFTGVLVVDGTEVPEEQLVRQAALNQVFFSPGEDQIVEEWAPGRNCVQAIVWPIAEGRAESRTVDWCFEVT